MTDQEILTKYRSKIITAKVIQHGFGYSKRKAYELLHNVACHFHKHLKNVTYIEVFESLYSSRSEFYNPDVFGMNPDFNLQEIQLIAFIRLHGDGSFGAFLKMFISLHRHGLFFLKPRHLPYLYPEWKFESPQQLSRRLQNLLDQSGKDCFSILDYVEMEREVRDTEQLSRAWIAKFLSKRSGTWDTH